MLNYIKKNKVKSILILIGVVAIVLILIYISTLNDYPNSTTRNFFEIMYFLTNSVLLFVAIVGLKQLGIAKESSKLTVTRESYKLAAEQCTHFLNYIIPLGDDILIKLDSKPLGNVKINIKDKKVVFKTEFNEENMSQLTDENISAILSVLNAIEAYSVFFTQRVADEKIAFSTLGHTYCSSVEKLLPFLLVASDYGKKGFTNTIKLYIAWSQRIEKENVLKDKLDAEQKLNETVTIDFQSLGT